MKDYETLRIPNVGSPFAGMICLIVSTNRVGLYMSVLDALGRPDNIVIHRGLKSNEGKLIIEAVHDGGVEGAIPINYDRRRISFYNREFLDLCKEMIRTYAGGEFTKGIFFTVRGVPEGEGMILFDFHRAMYRTVKGASKNSAKTARKAKERRREKLAGKKEAGAVEKLTASKAQSANFQTPLGFSMPPVRNSTY